MQKKATKIKTYEKAASLQEVKKKKITEKKITPYEDTFSIGYISIKNMSYVYGVFICNDKFEAITLFKDSNIAKLYGGVYC